MPLGSSRASTQPKPTAASSRPLGGALGAVVGGGAALSCCVVPLMFVFVGISGTWITHLTALSPYQPMFIAVAVGSIVYGHLARHRTRRACAAGSGCTQTVPSRLVGIGLWTGTGLVAVSLAANYAAPYLL